MDEPFAVPVHEDAGVVANRGTVAVGVVAAVVALFVEIAVRVVVVQAVEETGSGGEGMELLVGNGKLDGGVGEGVVGRCRRCAVVGCCRCAIGSVWLEAGRWVDGEIYHIAM